ncbi:MAG: YdeI/OmpD-associated family protein [Bacteroidota bacterium]
MKEYKFESVIQASEIGSGGAYIEFPFNVEKEFGVKGRVKVICVFENVEYRGSLVKMGTQCHIIGIPKDIRNKIGKNIGDKVQVRLYKDESERTVEVHPLLIEEFNRGKALQENYDNLSYTRKKEILNQLTSAKKEETLKSRLEKIVLELKRNSDRR